MTITAPPGTSNASIIQALDVAMNAEPAKDLAAYPSAYCLK